MRRLGIGLAVSLLLACGSPPRSMPKDWSAEALAKHAEVDLLLEHGDTKAARRTLLAMQEGLEQAQRTQRSGRLEGARKDTFFRLARLAMDEKDLAAALRDCEAGLQLGGGEDLFTANLLALRGTIRQELGQAVPAAEDLHQSLLINESLLKRALEP